jgi:alkylhydroperoxidase family enzyme
VVEPRTFRPGLGLALRVIRVLSLRRLHFDFRNTTVEGISESKTLEVDAMPRISAVQPPYEGHVGDRLEAMMPPGVPPILLFRTFVKNLPMAEAMGSWGSYELSKRLSLSMRDREIVIDRTCARCRCEYEWGVHVAFFADRVGLTAAQVTSLTHGGSTDPCWTNPRERVLIDVCDALHDASHIGDALWERLSSELTDAEILDLLMLCGWYHAISFVANGVELPLEERAPRFADVF